MAITINGTTGLSGVDGSAGTPALQGSDTNTGIYSPGANQVAVATNGAQRITVDASGRLLVGTSSSDSQFDSNVQITAAGVSTTLLSRYSNNTAGPTLFLAKSRGSSIGTKTVVQNGDESGKIEFRASDGANHFSTARIETYVDGTPGTNDMPGRLVFSTTASGASAPTERMRIQARGQSDFYGNSNVVSARSSSAASNTYFLFTGMHSATGVGNGTTSFRVWTNGNVENTNNSYGAISDIKLKENIVDATSQWDDLKALQVRNYNFKEGQTHTQIGLVAQEAELVSPGLVYESPDRDAEGNDLSTVTKSVNYSVLYMKAVKALQEAMERIETLEAKVAALESA